MLQQLLKTQFIQFLHKNKSIKGLTATAQATILDDATAAGNDGRDDYYAEVSYVLPTSFPLTVGAQYLATDYTAAATDDGKMYGLMVGTKFGAMTLEGFYNNNTSDGIVQGGWGLGNDPSYNDMWVYNGLGANQESYSVKAGYVFSPELSGSVWYGWFKPDAANSDVESLDLDVMYKPGYFKGFSLNAKYSTLDYDTPATKLESHLYFFAKYAF